MRFRELLTEDISTDPGPLTTLLRGIEDLQEDIDSEAMDFDSESQAYRRLERDYRALEAAANVVRNNLKALKNHELAKNSIFLYDLEGSTNNIESLGAIHVKLTGDIANVNWLGSYGASGRQLMQRALEQSRNRGAKRVKVTAKWDSEGFYRKMGLQQGTTTINPLAGSSFTDFSGDIK